MDAKELRIGNFVLRNKIVFEVWDLKRKELELDNELLDRHINYCTYDEIEPIPITEEWLLNLGFTANPYDDTYSKGDFEIFRKQEQYFFRHIELKYVHRLQNLFFEWTDQELTLETK